MKKEWCKHIKFYTDSKPSWRMNGWMPVPNSWKLCPICGAKRPTKANVSAAVNRAIQDGDQ